MIKQILINNTLFALAVTFVASTGFSYNCYQYGIYNDNVTGAQTSTLLAFETVASQSACATTGAPSLPTFQNDAKADCRRYQTSFGTSNVSYQVETKYNSLVIAKYPTTPALCPPPPACGSANNGSFATSPTTNLCAPGTASPVIVPEGNGYVWTWSCSGDSTAVSCKAYSSAQVSCSYVAQYSNNYDDITITEYPSYIVMNNPGGAVYSTTAKTESVASCFSGFSTFYSTAQSECKSRSIYKSGVTSYYELMSINGHQQGFEIYGNYVCP